MRYIAAIRIKMFHETGCLPTKTMWQKLIERQSRRYQTNMYREKNGEWKLIWRHVVFIKCDKTKHASLKRDILQIIAICLQSTFVNTIECRNMEIEKLHILITGKFIISTYRDWVEFDSHPPSKMKSLSIGLTFHNILYL